MSLIQNSTPPGTIVGVSAAAALPGASAGSTGSWFVVGLTQSGPVGVPIILTSFNDFLTICGARLSDSVMYDAVQAYFTLSGGGGIVYLSRVVGPAATVATVELEDSGSVATLKVSAIGPGTYGNSLSVAVISGSVSGSYQLVVSVNGTVVETSPPLLTTTDAVNWGNLNPAASATFASKYITVQDLGVGAQPKVVAATALTGGTDDDADCGDTQYEAGLNVFNPNLGPGQVSAPGRTTTATLSAVQNHAANNNRFFLIDGVNGASASTLAAAAASQQSGAIDPSYGIMVAGWVVWPGASTGTAVPPWNRQIPPCAIAAGTIAANDAAHDCNIAVAGANGYVPGALGVAQSFSQSDLGTLNSAGVCPFVQDAAGNVRLMGWSTLSLNPMWLDASNARFRMQLIHDGQVIGSQFDFAQIDGAGKTIAAFVGALTANLQSYWAAGSLYGASPAAAFSVNGGPSVNTPQTIANRQLIAVENVCMSPSAEWVEIQIVKYQVGQVVPPGATGTANGNSTTGAQTS